MNTKEAIDAVNNDLLIAEQRRHDAVVAEAKAFEEKQMYAGADWLEKEGKELSPLGREVADLVGDLYRGIYHIQPQALKADWSNERWIQLVIPGHYMSTFDPPNLTHLVILCHDRLIRCEIKPCNFNYLKLVFHKRQGREGRLYDRHPTIEKAVESCRNHYGPQTTR